MLNGHRLIAWIEPGEGHCLARFVAEAAKSLRAPATRRFSAPSEARGWVECEAAALGGVPVVWVDHL